MSLKSSLLALANNIGMCQENARNIKQVLAGGLAEVADAELYHVVKEIKADGVKSISALLDELYTEAHKSTGKILQYGGTVSFFAYPTRYTASSVEFEEVRIRSAGIQAHGFVIKETGSEYYETTNGTTNNNSTSIPASGTTITLYD